MSTQASAACGLFDFGLAEEPVRRYSRRFTFYQASVDDVDLANKICFCHSAIDGATKSFPISYDYLVLAPGFVCNVKDVDGKNP